MTHPPLPLCIDLDGTLILNDTTFLATKLLVKKNPLYLLLLALWILRGRAYYKHQLAKRIFLNPNDLPYRHSLVTYLMAEHHTGRQIYLVTATDYKFAKAISDEVGIFIDVFASDGITNLRAQAKADYLIAKFGDKKFIYAGNSFDDLHIWKHSAEAIVCSKDVKLLDQINKLHIKTHFFK